jgi:hypothetical protein
VGGAAAPAPGFRAGSKIVHRKFGHGVVVSASDEDEPVLTIAFPQAGVKKILASAVQAV